MHIAHELNAIVTIAARDVTKLFRDRTRILANLVFPLIFIGALGYSLQSNLGSMVQYNFLTFVFTGVLAQTLFQSTASGIISLIEDRQNDFAQALFVTPVSRVSLILGKILGEMCVSLMQGGAIILLGLIIQVPFDLFTIFKIVPVALLIGLFGGSFGVLVMSNLTDQRSANQLFPFLIFPQFFLAGVFNPIQDLPPILMVLSRIAPLTYAVDLMRSMYYGTSSEAAFTVLNSPLYNLAIVLGMTTVFLLIGTTIFIRNERNK